MSCGTTLQFYLQSKNIWVTSTLFWSSQLHACCVDDTLHNFKRDGSYLNQSLSVLEKLLSQLGFFTKTFIAIWLHSWHLYQYHKHATKALLQGQICRIKETPTSPEML